jgi:hypothetical protein
VYWWASANRRRCIRGKTRRKDRSTVKGCAVAERKCKAGEVRGCWILKVGFFPSAVFDEWECMSISSHSCTQRTRKEQEQSGTSDHVIRTYGKRELPGNEVTVTRPDQHHARASRVHIYFLVDNYSKLNTKQSLFPTAGEFCYRLF